MVRMSDEERKAFAYLKEHYPTTLTDAQSVPRDELENMVRQAVLHNNLSTIDTDRLAHRLLAQLVGPGALTPYFDDPGVTEIMVVGDRIYIERDGQVRLESHLPSPSAAIELAQHLCQHCHEEYQTTHPLINLTWPENGARINIVHHAISPTGVAITVRKRNQERLLDMQDVLTGNMLTESAAVFLIETARAKMNMFISGSPSSGKSTLLRAIASEAIDAHERLIVLEDTEELRLPFEHMIVMIGSTETLTPEEKRQGIVSMNDLFRNSLRQRPDRIIVGETRGAEVFDLLQASISGEGGVFSTIHLRRPDALFVRLIEIADRAGYRITETALQKMMPIAVDVMVQVDKDSATGLRHVSRIVESLPDGTWRDLFVWDADAQTLRPQGTLTREHKLWLATHRTGRQVLRRAIPPTTDVWRDLLIPVVSA